MRSVTSVLIVLMLTTAGCAGSEATDGNDLSGVSETVAEQESRPEASSTTTPDEPLGTVEPSADTSNSDLKGEIVEESERVESEGTASAVETSPTEEKSTPSPSTTAPAPEEPPPPAVVESGAVDKAKADLAARLGIAADSIEALSVQEVDWPDTSIGCPQPDMVYSQVITNGSRIILSHSGVPYSYHSAATGDPFYCENPTDPVPGSET